MTRIGLDKGGWVVPFLCNNSKFHRFEPVFMPETLLSAKSLRSRKLSLLLLRAIAARSRTLLLAAICQCQFSKSQLPSPARTGSDWPSPWFQVCLRAKTLSQSISVSSQEQDSGGVGVVCLCWYDSQLLFWIRG